MRPRRNNYMRMRTPQTEQLYAYEDDDWGEMGEDRSQWAADEWEASDHAHQQEAYAYQEDHESQVLEEEVAQESDEHDEDDQDNYE